MTYLFKTNDLCLTEKIIFCFSLFSVFMLNMCCIFISACIVSEMIAHLSVRFFVNHFPNIKILQHSVTTLADYDGWSFNIHFRSVGCIFSILEFVFIIGLVYSSFLWVLSLWGFGIKMITCRLFFFLILFRNSLYCMGIICSLKVWNDLVIKLSGWASLQEVMLQ